MKNTLNTLVLALLMISLSLPSCTSENKDTSTSKTVMDSSTPALTASPKSTLASFKEMTVAPPLQEIDVPYTHFEHKVSTAQTLKLPTGSSIEIPNDAFVDANGVIVTTPVDIQFREFHTPAEIIASGIPMRVFDENNEMHWMQTAGMFEIKGFSEGEEVFIAKGKDLKVNLTCEVEGSYDFWYYDAKTDNWIDQGDSEAVANPNLNVSPSAVANQAPPANPNPVASPTAPATYDPNKSTIDLAINYSEYPELQGNEGAIWQYAGNNLAEDPGQLDWVQKEEWTEIALKKQGKDTYLAVFESDEKEYKVPVKMVLRGKAYDEAFARYQAEMKNYQTYVQSEAARIAEWKANARQRAEKKKSEKAFLRSVLVSDFGMYNYDIFYKMAEALPLYANFDFQGTVPEEFLNEVTVYHITGNKKAVLSLPYYNWKNFKFSPKQDNSFLAVLPGNRIATFSAKKFSKEVDKMKQAANKDYVFAMDVVDEEITSLEELEDLFSDD